MTKKEREEKLKKQVVLYGRQNRRLEKIKNSILQLKKELKEPLIQLEEKIRTINKSDQNH